MPSSSTAAAAPLHVTHVRSFPARAGPSDPRARKERWRSPAAAVAESEGPSCLFVGPIETASKEMLEAFYQQARFSYYNGKPLIVDDMFDKVELKLRLYGSKYVVKYPRCSLRRQSTYADAEVLKWFDVGQEDPSLVVALASVWVLLLMLGSSAILVPIIYAVGQAFTEAIHSRYFLNVSRSPYDMLMMLNCGLSIGLGCLIGYPVASASVQALQGLLKNDLVALKGSCPNCGEEVFAFVRAEKSNLHPHSIECHVCESSLVFRSKVEKSISRPGRRWVYGRIYLVQQTYNKSQRRK